MLVSVGAAPGCAGQNLNGAEMLQGFIRRGRIVHRP